ncbi:MAG: hypothetical protein HFG61_12265 [Lachnospiraceae bacterium]|nr:hypothetical protein [Lachnospiraceae bacterium]
MKILYCKGRKKKSYKVTAAMVAFFLSAGLSTTVYGGEWKRDNVGWWYQNNDGTWQANGWFTDVDGKSYYFNESGYMLANTTTPDGQKVGGDGALIPGVRSLPSNKGDLYYRGLRQVLDSMILYPQASTGYSDLDALLDQVFSQIITADMDTHDKLKACYDYLIAHTEYGVNSYWGDSYHSAYGVLTEKLGVCDDYSAAFAVMARKIGVPVYTVSGSTHKSNGEFTGHTWCHLDYNGVTYVFDPQVEDVIANGRGGSIMYIRFGGTTAQLADKYRFGWVADDFSTVPGSKGTIGGGGGNQGSGNNRPDDKRSGDLSDWWDWLGL